MRLTMTGLLLLAALMMTAAPAAHGAQVLCQDASSPDVYENNLCFRSDVVVSDEETMYLIESSGCPDHKNMQGSSGLAGSGCGAGCCGDCSSGTSCGAGCYGNCGGCGNCGACTSCGSCGSCSGKCDAGCGSSCGSCSGNNCGSGKCDAGCASCSGAQCSSSCAGDNCAAGCGSTCGSCSSNSCSSGCGSSCGSCSSNSCGSGCGSSCGSCSSNSCGSGCGSSCGSCSSNSCGSGCGSSCGSCSSNSCGSGCGSSCGSCSSNSCGSGCGSSCGSCSSNSCGSGCGSSCGSCYSNSCGSGKCDAGCASCSGTQCGSDSCSGSCSSTVVTRDDGTRNLQCGGCGGCGGGGGGDDDFIAMANPFVGNMGPEEYCCSAGCCGGGCCGGGCCGGGYCGGGCCGGGCCACKCNGCSGGKYAPMYQNYRVTIPKTPSELGDPQYPQGNDDDDVVGIMANGVLLDSHKATWSYDSCNGHSDTKHMYHYHIPPKCFLESMGIAYPEETFWWKDGDQIRNYTDMGAQWPATSAPSPVIGFALDGYPIFGPYDSSGTVQHGKDYGGTVDECNGKMDSVGNYAYYLTVDPPFAPPCLRGEKGTFTYETTDKYCPADGIESSSGGAMDGTSGSASLFKATGLAIGTAAATAVFCPL